MAIDRRGETPKSVADVTTILIRFAARMENSTRHLAAFVGDFAMRNHRKAAGLRFYIYFATENLWTVVCR